MGVLIGTVILVAGMMIGQNSLDYKNMAKQNDDLNKKVVILQSENKNLSTKLNSQPNKNIVKSSTPKIDGIEVAYLGD